jgi:molecular chaperone DnaK (HSP70)
VLGTFQLDGIPPAPRGTPKIKITYDLSSDGILNVSAEVEGKEGTKKSLTITNDKKNLSDEEIQRMVKEAEDFKEQDKQFKERLEAKNNLETMLYQFRSQSELPEETKTKIEEEIKWLEEHPEETKEVYDEHRSKIMGLFQPPADMMQPPPTTPTTEEVKPEENIKIEEVD